MAAIAPVGLTAQQLSEIEFLLMRRKDLQRLADPNLFIPYFLQADLWEVQQEIAASVARPHSKTVVKACHASGKTHCAARLALWFLAAFEESIVVSTAPTDNQIRKLLWGEIHAALAKSTYHFPKANTQDLSFGPKHYATGFTTSVTKSDEGVKFSGFHAEHVLVIVDEAPGIDPKIWDAIEGATAGGDVRQLALGNPTIASGSFHTFFHGGRSAWNAMTISAFDTPNFKNCKLTYYDEEEKKTVTLGNGSRDLMEMTDEELDDNPMPFLITKRWVKDRFLIWGPHDYRFQARALGQFPTQSEDALLSLVWLERAQKDERSADGKITVGLDVAGPGEDETVLVARRGFQILMIEFWPQADPRGQIVAKLKELQTIAEIDAVNVDSAGIGYYLLKHLQDLDFPAVGINVGEAPRDTEQFFNLKAELYWGLRMRVKDGDMAGLTDETTISQLAGIRWKPNSRGQTVIESKEDARKRGVKSPDRAEAVMLAFADIGYSYGLIELGKQRDANVLREAKEMADKAKNMSKPDRGAQSVECPSCGGRAVVMIGGKMHCNACGNNWMPEGKAAPKGTVQDRSGMRK